MALETADGNALDCYSHFHPDKGWTVHLHQCGQHECANVVLTPLQAGELARTLVDVLPRDGDEQGGLGPLGRLVLPPAPSTVGGKRLVPSSMGMAALVPGAEQCGHRFHDGSGSDHSCWLVRGHGGDTHGDRTHVWAAGS